jgi:hypothetical protein
MIDFATYTQWSGYLTNSALILTILAFALKWGFRFRFVGITGFMAVLTIGLFGLSLGLFSRTDVPGAVRFIRVYDNGANQVVISVPPTITETELRATLLQASNDYFSYGRGSRAGDKNLTVRARTMLHPKPGVSEPIYLGQARSALGIEKEGGIDIEISKKSFAKLPKKVS